MAARSRKGPHPQVLVEGLPIGVDEPVLRRFLESQDVEHVDLRASADAPNEKVAIVEFRSARSANDAVTRCNYQLLEGRRIYVTHHQPGGRLDERSLLLFTGIPVELSDRGLHDALSPLFPKIVVVRIRLAPNGTSSGSAVVRFEDTQSADDAITRDGADLFGRALTIRRLQQASSATSVIVPRNVLVVESRATPEQITSGFRSFGRIHSIDQIGDRFVVFFNDSVHDKLLAYDGSLKVATRIARDFAGSPLPDVEARTVFVSVTPANGSVEAPFIEHMAKVGNIVFSDIHQNAAANLFSGTIQYVTRGAKLQAVERLDGTIYEDGGIPIRVLPYFNSGLVHPPAGMLQLNGVPPSTSFDTLKRRFATYGPVVATTLTPTWFGELIGFVLFERYEDGERAAAEHPNSLLYPAGDPADFIKGFTESDKVTGNCVVIYDLPVATSRDSFQRQCQRIPSLQSAAVIADGSTKVGFAYYGSAKGIAAACGHFAADGYRVGVLNGNGLVFALRLLNRVKLPYQWEGCILFLGRLPSMSNLELFAELSNYGRVIAVFQTITAQSGERATSGVALFADAAQAGYVLAASQERQLIVRGSSVIASLFRNQSFIERPAAKPAPAIPMLADKMSAREFLRQFIAQNVANLRQRELALAGVGAMSVNDTYRLRDSLYSYPPQHTPQSLLDFLLQQTKES
jgi:RNA recognition motif-containing protein